MGVMDCENFCSDKYFFDLVKEMIEIVGLNMKFENMLLFLVLEVYGVSDIFIILSKDLGIWVIFVVDVVFRILFYVVVLMNIVSKVYVYDF